MKNSRIGKKQNQFHVESLEERTLLARVPVLQNFTSLLSVQNSPARLSPRPVNTPVQSSNNFLKSAVAVNSTTIQIGFRQPIDRSVVNNMRYEVSGLNILKSQMASDRRSVTLTTSSHQDLNYHLKVSILKGPASRPRVTVQRMASFQGAPAPQILSVATASSSSVVVTFDQPMSDQAQNVDSYSIVDAAGKPLPVTLARFDGVSHKVVILTTATQAVAGPYTLTVNGVKNSKNESPQINSSNFVGFVSENYDLSGSPRVVGAASLGNTELIVSFNEPMSDNALKPENYFINQETQNRESGRLPVTAAEFYQGNPSVVKLTTLSQSAISYRVVVIGVTDQAGNIVDSKPAAFTPDSSPNTAVFYGSAPVGTTGNNSPVVTLKDSDSDGIPDNIELRGYSLTITRFDASTSTYGVNSDPFLADTDGDGLSDAVEATIGTDPRSNDTDIDQLGDYAEYNEVYSNPNAVDTDKDGLDDFLEWGFFRTSPVFADSDGDQIKDGDEIIGNRNPLVSDLPRPEISVGNINLQLDVRFTETKNTQQRDLENRSISTSLSSSTNQSFSNVNTSNIQAHVLGGNELGKEGKGRYFEGGVTGGATWESSETSALESAKAYTESLSTDKEVTKGFDVQREVQGATMQVAVSLRNLSNLAYRVKNVQVTALIQDPLDKSKLVPVATLLPDSEPDEGFMLGALDTNLGPFIFSNSTIVPTLVESLMANSTGLIFRISNYDIIDESGRNFAFTSQEVVERTSSLVIDFGGATSLVAKLSGAEIDPNKPGDETEIYRVSTSGGQTIDTNFDGQIDQNDRRATFDATGKEVGITFFDGLAAIGLKHYQAIYNSDTKQYDEIEPETGQKVSLSYEQKLASFSTFVDGPGREKVFRIRGVANDALNQKYWEIITPLGIDQITDLKKLILKTDSPVSVNFVQDLDGDGLTADVEYFLGTSDSPDQMKITPVPNPTDFIDEHGYVWGNPTLPDGFTPGGYVDSKGLVWDDPNHSIKTPKGRDTDADGLDDRFEALIGWTVNTATKRFKVFSSPRRSDSNFDSLDDSYAAPQGWIDKNNNHLRDQDEVSQRDKDDFVLDPSKPDTDGDRISDFEEIIKGVFIVPLTGGDSYSVMSNPLSHDTDRDTFSDGFEKQVGLNPTDDRDKDSDGDSLPDPVEVIGWFVNTWKVSTSPYIQGNYETIVRTSDPNKVDTDGDGFDDFEEFGLGLNAKSADTDGDGLNDLIEVKGFALKHKIGEKDLGIITTNPLDADTDNDLRSDGAEAELQDVELYRWVVRVVGGIPYRVFSNPLVADADFDGLVDGQEHSYHQTDPNNGNTDGDLRNDGEEFDNRTNPLVTDAKVTIIGLEMEGLKGVLPGNHANLPARWSLSLYKADPNEPLGFSKNAETVIDNSVNRMEFKNSTDKVLAVVVRTGIGLASNGIIPINPRSTFRWVDFFPGTPMIFTWFDPKDKDNYDGNFIYNHEYEFATPAVVGDSTSKNYGEVNIVTMPAGNLGFSFDIVRPTKTPTLSFGLEKYGIFQIKGTYYDGYNVVNWGGFDGTLADDKVFTVFQYSDLLKTFNGYSFSSKVRNSKDSTLSIDVKLRFYIRSDVAISK